jgi:hypothetical protein
VSTYYEPVDDLDDFEYTEDNGEECVFELPDWKLKQNAVNKRETWKV